MATGRLEVAVRGGFAMARCPGGRALVRVACRCGIDDSHFYTSDEVERGFQTEGRLVFSTNIPSSYIQQGVGKQFLDRLREQLSAVPSVVAAGAVSQRPMEGGDPGNGG